MVNCFMTKNPPPADSIGFLARVGGGVDGLMSCTESLGFESSDERTVDPDQIDNIVSNELRSRTKWEAMGSTRRRTTAESEVKNFPPPLSSMSRDGKPVFFLHPQRKDGRLELTTVMIHRPQILHASREDGRLRLHLIRDVDDIEDDQQAELEEIKMIEEENIGGVRWQFPATDCGGDCLRRCNEAANRRQHHHDMHTWTQRCMTSR